MRVFTLHTGGWLGVVTCISAASTGGFLVKLKHAVSTLLFDMRFDTLFPKKALVDNHGSVSRFVVEVLTT